MVGIAESGWQVPQSAADRSGCIVKRARCASISSGFAGSGINTGASLRVKLAFPSGRVDSMLWHTRQVIPA
jgi:hypothetical protein